jgi:hypothetical protein
VSYLTLSQDARHNFMLTALAALSRLLARARGFFAQSRRPHESERSDRMAGALASGSRFAEGAAASILALACLAPSSFLLQALIAVSSFSLALPFIPKATPIARFLFSSWLSNRCFATLPSLGRLFVLPLVLWTAAIHRSTASSPSFDHLPYNPADSVGPNHLLCRPVASPIPPDAPSPYLTASSLALNICTKNTALRTA